MSQRTLFKTLREQGTVRAYLGLLLKRHRAILAYLGLTLAVVVSLTRIETERNNDLKATIMARCEAVNEFRRSTNRQFSHFVDHNNAAVVLFAEVGQLLTNEASTPAFRALGSEFTEASEYYRHLAKRFHPVPLEDCANPKLPEG